MKQILLLLGNVSPLLTALISAPITARAIGPEGRGEVSVALLVASLVQVVGAWGLPWLARRDFAERGGGSTRDWVRRATVAALLSSPIAVVGYFWVTSNYSLSDSEKAPFALLLMVSALSALRGVLGNLLISSSRAWLYGLSLVAASIVTLVLLLVFALMQNLTVGTAVLASTGGFVVSIVMLALVAKTSGVSKDQKRRRASVMNWRQSMAVWTTQLTEFLISRADVILVVFLGAAAQIGIYSIASIISVATYAVATTVVQMSYTPARFGWGLRRLPATVHVCLLAGFVIAVAAVPSLEVIFPLIFGPEFADVREFGFAVPLMVIASSLLAPVIGLGADGSRWTYILACCSGIALIASVALGGTSGDLPLAVSVMATLLIVSSLGILVLATRGEVLVFRIGDLKRWIKGSAL